LVLTDALLEEVGLALHGDELHPVERILRVEDLLAAQACEKAVSDELNVLCHEAGVHADELAIQGLADELALDLNSTADDFLHDLFGELILHHGVQQAGEIGVETLVAGDELVGESKTGHEATLLEPVDGAERSGEEDTLDAGEGNKTLGEGRVVVDPVEGPFGLLLDGGDLMHGAEEMLLLLGVLDVGIDEEGVSLGVDVLHHHLEAVKGTSLGDLHLVGEHETQVFVDDTIARREEGEDHLDEVLLFFVEVLPVGEVRGEIDFFSGPEGSLLLFVLFPDAGVLNGEDDEAVLILHENLFVLLEFLLLGRVELSVCQEHTSHFEIEFTCFCCYLAMCVLIARSVNEVFVIDC